MPRPVNPKTCQHGEAELRLGRGGGAFCRLCGTFAGFADAAAMTELRAAAMKIKRDHDAHGHREPCAICTILTPPKAPR